MAETRKRRLAAFFSVAAVIVVIAALAGLWFRSRPPRFTRGERNLVSPVLKPTDLGDRKFLDFSPIPELGLSLRCGLWLH
jgi:hypothetical protein